MYGYLKPVDKADGTETPSARAHRQNKQNIRILRFSDGSWSNGDNDDLGLNDVIRYGARAERDACARMNNAQLLRLSIDNEAWLIAFTLVRIRGTSAWALLGRGGVLLRLRLGLGFGLGLGLGDRGLGGVAVLEHLQVLVLGVLDRA